MSGLPAPVPAVTMEAGAGAGAGLVMVDGGGEQLAGPGHAPGPAQDQLQTPPTFPGQPPPSHEAVNFANEVGPPRHHLDTNAQYSASHMFTLVFVVELYFSTIDRAFISKLGRK